MDTTNDRFAILELMHNYILSIDTHDVDEFTANFTEDGVYESPFGVAHGSASIRDTIGYWHSSGITKGKRHFIGAIRILEVNGDTARVESNYWIAEAETIPGIVATGAYTDMLRKQDGMWKIANRKQTIDPSWKPPVG
jgi:SnoaL-like domain